MDKETFKVVDASGLRCPQPIIELQNAARSGGPGSLICLVSTDHGTLHDIPVWIKVNRHELIETNKEKGSYYFYVKIK